MYDVDVIDSTDTHRVTVSPAEYAEEPDGDCYPTILRRDYSESAGWYVYAVVHAAYVPGVSDTARGRIAAELSDRLTAAEYAAHEYGGRDEWEAAETVLVRSGAVDWHTFTSNWDRSGSDYLAVTFDDEPDWTAEKGSSDWQAWLDGSVYDVAVEVKSVGTVHPDAVFYVGSETFEAWHPVETDYGYGALIYGRDAAEQYAAELFAPYAAGSEVSA